ncbi:MAG: DUF6171 family protein [Eubacteriales bacterium]|nr:DUF6171 family protein [Eubacteriales bacterium]
MPVICRRCLLAEMESERPLYLLMREWLAAVPPEERAEPERYEARLTACRQCDALGEGLCALCGCYVELRAAKARASCPAAPPRWMRAR